MRALPLLLLGAACSRAPLPDGIGDGSAALDGGAPDLAAADLAHGACTQRVLSPVVLVSIDPLDGARFVGAAVRVAVTYRRAACDPPGPIAVEQAGGQFKVTARVWQGGAGCPSTVERRVLLLPVAAPGIVMVRDAAPGGNLAVTFGVGPPAPPTLPVKQLGDPCATTADCAPLDQPDGRALCVPIAPQKGRCLYSCSEGADCPGVAPGCGAAQVAPNICGFAGCMSDGECPPGQACVAAGQLRACRPKPGPGGPVPCACDEDCDYGVCFQHDCQVPCVDTADCSPATTCEPSFGVCAILP